MKFSKREIKDLVKAWFFISLAFSILFSGGINLFQNLEIHFFIIFVISGLTVGISFLIHEILHKYMALRYGYKAEFRSFDKMLYLSLVMSLFGFIIAAPGAVMIKAVKISREKNGKISLSGPLSNLVLALLFLIPFLLFSGGLLGTFFRIGFLINSLLAAFNLLPIPGFDGKKVYDWNKSVYSIVISLAGILFFTSMVVGF